MSPKVSIIIPCYNQAAYLTKAIESLQAQTLAEWECIIVDDGSTDETKKVAQTLSAKDPRIQLVHKSNGGSASARNMGLKQARGTFIQFLDADDYIDSLKLEKQVEQMEAFQTDMSYTAFRHRYADGTESKILFVKLNAVTVLTRWGLGGSIPPHAFLFRNKFLQAHHITFDEECRYREDWNWAIQCFHAHPKTNVLADYCGAYYMHYGDSKTSSYLKMQSGNFTFMAHKYSSLSGWKRLLWDFRISEELWIWMLRMVKYRSLEAFSLIRLMHKNIHTRCCLLIAFLLLPIAFWWTVGYFIKTYLAK